MEQDIFAVWKKKREHYDVFYTYANMTEALSIFCLLPVGNFTDAFKIELEEVAVTTSSSEKHTNAPP